MKARPIPLKPHEVRGILDGRKTQMRRVVDRLSGIGRVTEFQSSEHPGFDFIFRNRRMGWMTLADVLERCPLGQPGDLLWVRETWRPIFGQTGQHIETDYKATPTERMGDLLGGDPSLRWKPSIHMPRAESRITLEVTGIRVERLQDISEEDARAEGITKLTSSLRSGLWTADGKSFTSRGPVKCFRDLWEHRLTAKNVGSSWDANPWVWVMEFRPHLMNIDQFLKQREAA